MSATDAEKRIFELSNRLYTAISEFPIAEVPDDLRTAFEGFPSGCCDDACYLLQQWLTDNDEGGFLRYCGENYDPYQSHVWLERSGLIVDITGGQFPGWPNVYVGTDKTMPNSFEETKLREGTLMDLGEHSLRSFYYALCRRLRSSDIVAPD